MVKFFLGAALSLGVAGLACADPFLQDDLKWLETMAFAAHQTNYSGTFIYQYGSHVETSRITHVVDANGEHGRLESLDGQRREVIRSNGEVWCYFGDKKIKVEGHAADHEFPALLQDTQLSRINQNYVVTQAGEARVAGIHAHAILFQPRDNLRYGHRMWADSNSGLLLKAEVIDEHGDIVEQYAFTQLALGGDVDRSWIDQEVPGGAAKAAHRPAAADRAAPAPAAQSAPSGWQVDSIPPGFFKVAEVRRAMHHRPASAIQMVYSDGLAGISVFIEDNDSDEDDHAGLTSQGAIQVYSREQDGHLVTVVGEVPPQTVIDVGDSVRYAGK
jgi:sigma-E factor negative regulatory protein RseB